MFDYFCDAFDRRIGKDLDSDADGQPDQQPRYVYDGQHIALAFSGDQATDLQHRYLYGPAIDRILADEAVHHDGQQYVSDEVYWPLVDHLGSVRDVAVCVSGITSVSNHLVYSAFGQVLSETPGGPQLPFAFTGRELDRETGQYYYRARYYDAAVGRFLSEDPIGFRAGDANLSRYVGNGPTIAADPSGLQAPVVAPKDVAQMLPRLPESRIKSLPNWNSSLSAQEISKWKGQWVQVDVVMYIAPYFSSFVSSGRYPDARTIQMYVSEFLEQYGIAINWTTIYLPTRVENAQVGSAPGLDRAVRHYYREYFDKLDVSHVAEEKLTFDNLGSPAVQWYRNTFSAGKNKYIQVFLINELDVKGPFWSTSYGLADRKGGFAWIPNQWTETDFGKVVAHEVLHVLGLDDTTLSGAIMSEDGGWIDWHLTGSKERFKVASSPYARAITDPAPYSSGNPLDFPQLRAYQPPDARWVEHGIVERAQNERNNEPTGHYQTYYPNSRTHGMGIKNQNHTARYFGGEKAGQPVPYDWDF